MSATVTIGNPTVDSYQQVARQFLGEYLTVQTGTESMSPLQIEQPDLVGSLRVAIPDFGYCLTAPIVDLSPETGIGKVSLTVAIDESVLVLVTLTGSLLNDGQFRIQHTGLKVEATRNRARADFIASTFWAMLGLAESVRLQVPELELDLSLGIRLELSAISEMLQRRLLAYRLMVIERATGREFELPSFIPPEQVKNTALIYHAIVKRSFEWPIGFVEYGWPATNEVRDRIVELNSLSFVRLGPHPESRVLFGQVVPLGSCFITILDKLVEDFDRVLVELGRQDGRIVRVVIRSLTGRGTYDFLHPPRLPNSPWESEIQQLVDLESKLDGRLVQRYNELAAATLAGLSDDEKNEVTERPELDETAFDVEF
jgi:hypothetical protein